LVISCNVFVTDSVRLSHLLINTVLLLLSVSERMPGECEWYESGQRRRQEPTFTQRLLRSLGPLPQPRATRLSFLRGNKFLFIIAHRRTSISQLSDDLDLLRPHCSQITPAQTKLLIPKPPNLNDEPIFFSISVHSIHTLLILSATLKTS